MAVERICGYDPAGSYIFRKLPVLIHNLSVYREVISISFDPQPYELIARFLQLRSDDIFLHSHVHGKGYKGRRHIDILECPGHTVLSSDRRKPKPDLSRIGAQQSCKRLAPSLRIFGHTAEIFLECKADLPVVSARRNDLRHGLSHRIHSSVVRAPARQIRVESIAHHGHTVCLPFQDRHLCHHCLRLCELIFPAVRHKHRSCADGAVEHFHKAFL